MTILVLDGETNQALATVRSLAAAGYRVLVASSWRRPLASWSRHTRKTYVMAGATIPAFLQTRDWAADEDVRLVLPLTERACVLCNATRSSWEEAGIAVGCAPEALLEQAFDKARTLEWAARVGLRTPSNAAPASLADYAECARRFGLPCVIKPRFSHAWDGQAFRSAVRCAYVYDAQALGRAVVERRQGAHWPLVQGYVEGQGKGVFALCDRGRVVAWGAHERLRDVHPTGSGSSLRRSIPVEARLQEPAGRLLAAMQWHGPAMIEFRDDGRGEPCLIEMNGRFWNSLQLMIDAGVDFPRLWIELLLGRDVEAAGCREGITLRWLWGDVKRLLHIVNGPPDGYRGAYPSIWQGLKEVLGAQPPGTRMEIWRRADPWPAVGEWHQGLREALARSRTRA